MHRLKRTVYERSQAQKKGCFSDDLRNHFCAHIFVLVNKQVEIEMEMEEEPKLKCCSCCSFGRDSFCTNCVRDLYDDSNVELKVRELIVERSGAEGY